MGSIMGSQNIMGSDYGSNISERHTTIFYSFHRTPHEREHSKSRTYPCSHQRNDDNDDLAAPRSSRTVFASAPN